VCGGATFWAKRLAANSPAARASGFLMDSSYYYQAQGRAILEVNIGLFKT
jgi:hypothetical protein